MRGKKRDRNLPGIENSIRFQIIKRQYDYPKHLHQLAELLLPVDEPLDLIMAGKRETISVGQAALIFPFQTHEYKSDRVNKLAIFMFSPAMISDFFGITDGRVGTKTVFNLKDSTVALFNERIFCEGAELDVFNTKGALYLLLNDFLEDVPLKDAAEGIDVSATIVDYINAHIREEISLADIAEVLNYNPNYLSSKIQELFGMNLPSLIASIRSDKAKYLLYETNKTGLEICYECGFGSERTFHRQFKAITGSTPKEYRNNLASKDSSTHEILRFF